MATETNQLRESDCEWGEPIFL